MGHDDGGPLDLLDDIGDGEGFTGAGYPQQRLVCQTGLDTIHQPFDCLGLIARWLERRINLEHTLSGGNVCLITGHNWRKPPVKPTHGRNSPCHSRNLAIHWLHDTISAIDGWA